MAAYLKNKSKVLDKMKDLNIVCYSITGIGGKPILSENEDEKLNLDEAIDRMSDDLDSFEGTVEVTLREVSKRTRNQGGATKNNHVYLIRLGSANNDSGSQNNMFQLMMQLQDARIEMLKKEFSHKEELREAKATKKKDKESKLDQYLPMLISRYLPVIDQKMGIGGAPMPLNNAPAQQRPTINGIDEENIIMQQKQAENIAKINNCIDRFMKLDPDFVNNLEALTMFAEKNPDQYSFVLNIVKDANAKQPA